VLAWFLAPDILHGQPSYISSFRAMCLQWAACIVTVLLCTSSTNHYGFE